MRIDITSLCFGFKIAKDNDSGTPAWATSIAQAPKDICYIQEEREGLNNILYGMMFKAHSDFENLKDRDVIGLDSNEAPHGDRERMMFSVFEDVFVNELKVNGIYTLTYEKENTASHKNRKHICYAKYLTYNGHSNKATLLEMAKVLGCSENACWFVYDISVKKQSELHFSAIVVNAEKNITYESSKSRKQIWEGKLLEKIKGLDTDNNSNKVLNSSWRYQIIYYGAPGTGKSFEIDKFTKEYDTIRTTFHPDSDYSTFVGAYKPIMEEVDVPIVPVVVAGGITLNTNNVTYKEKKISYKFVKQAFLKAYLAAWKKYAESDDENRVQPQFLVIEEINRGNCAQIFGDLFQLLDRQDNGFSSYPIEADADLKREIGEAFAEEGGEYQLSEGGMKLDGVVKNYKGNLESDIRSGRILLLPSNLYIWATMNTSDQSLFPIDSAFKRRWDWHYVKIADAKKDYKIECGDEACDWWTFISKMNDKIAAETNSDDKKLGYFFCKPDKEGDYISLKRFVSKVIFYLWNDVYKDGNTEDFSVSDDPSKEATFEAFYNDDNTVNVANVRKFLVNIVGVENIVKSDEDNEEYPGTQANEDDHAHDDWSDTEKKRYQYWDAFLKYAPKKSEEFAQYFGGVKTPSNNHWTNFSVSNVDFHLTVLQQRVKRALEMKVSYDETTEEYYKLYSNKAEIEAEMGVTYQWQELPDKKSSYISEYKSDVDFDNEEAWPEQFDFIIDRLLRMRAVFSRYAKM